MHELGHNLGLEHGGADCFNFKPNYVSVMNYNFYTLGIPVGSSPGDIIPKSCNTDSDCTSGDHPSGTQHCSDAVNSLGFRQCIRIDYSDREFNSLDENGATTGINEELGLQGGTNNTDISWYKSGQFWRAPTNGSFVDFKHDGFVSTALIFDVSGDGQKTQLISENDWSHLLFTYQCQTTFEH